MNLQGLGSALRGGAPKGALPAQPAAVAIENWVITYPVAASAASFTKNFGTVQRTGGGVSVNTSTSQFNLSPRQDATVLSIYVSGTPSADGMIDFFINENDMNLGIVASTVNAQAGAGREYAPTVYFPIGVTIRPVFWNLAAQSTASSTSVTVFAKVQVLTH